MLAVVTGASGHIGANLVRALVERGDRVRALVHRATSPLDGLDVEIVHGDVLDSRSLRHAFSGADVVYHLAGVISLGGRGIRIMRAVNADGAEAAARAALDAGVGRLVHCSSVHAFSVQPGTGLDESGARVPDAGWFRPAYDRSKAEGERRVRAVLDEGLDAVIVHPTSVIGPFDFEPSRMGRFFLRLHRRTLPALVSGAFDFVDVRDVATALIAAASQGRRGESYLISGHRATVPDLARVASAVTGRRSPRVTVPIRVAGLAAPALAVSARVARTEPLYTRASLHALRSVPRIDSSKARRELALVCRPLQETVRDVYDWFESAGMLAPAAGGRDRPGP